MTSSSTICIDANIVVKLLVPTSSKTILDLWDSWRTSPIRLVAPTLIQFEVSNALYQMTRHGFFDVSTASQAVETMSELPIQLFNHQSAHRRSVELATKFGIKATYDAHYLALSEHLECDLWTTDKRFFNAVHADCDWVRLIEES